MNTQNKLTGLWNTRLARAFVLGAGLIVMLAGNKAEAATRSAAPAMNFGELGTKLAGFLCSFITSPIVGVVVGVSILALLLLMTMNEDNGLLSKALKVLVGGMAILFIPSLLSMLGFDIGCSAGT